MFVRQFPNQIPKGMLGVFFEVKSLDYMSHKTYLYKVFSKDQEHDTCYGNMTSFFSKFQITIQIAIYR